MRLRRFNGPDPAAALKRVKEALGPDAIILGSRPCDAGVEITAAVDLDALEDASPPAADGGPRFHDDLAEITRELRSLSQRVARIEPTSPSSAGRRLKQEGRAVMERLVLHGMAPALATRIARGFQKGRGAGKAPERALGEALAHHLAAAERPPRRIEAFVGPTGCGKTTTIAKLAAATTTGGGTRVGLVMADTHRVGATGQLEAYARLLDARVETADDPAALVAALERLEGCDAIFVDTAGVGGDAAAVRDLRALLAPLGDDAGVTAVVSASLSASALERAWQRLAPLGPRECVVTKLDESPGLAATCSWVAETGMRLRWLGIGRRVPGDLAEASGDALAHWLCAA